MKSTHAIIGLKVGQVALTGDFFYDVAADKHFPIYRKRLAVGALGNAGAVNVAHGEANIKLDGLLEVVHLQASSGAAGATARTNKNSTGLSFGFTAANVVITDTTDLSAQAGSIEIDFCRTTD